MITAISSVNASNSRSSIAFKGNPLGKLSGKVSRLVGKDELPIVKKPITAADWKDDAIDVAQDVGDTVEGVVPFVGPGLRAIKTIEALAEGDMQGVVKQGAGFAKSAAKQATFATISTFTGPAAPVTYIVLNVGWALIKKIF